MTELIDYPDAERVVATVLRTLLGAVDTDAKPFAAGVKVGTRYPPGVNPGKFVRLRRSGGTPAGAREDAPRIDFQVWYETGATDDDENRMELALLVRGLVYSARNTIAAGGRIGQITEFLGPGRFEDPVNSAREIILFTEEIRLRANGA